MAEGSIIVLTEHISQRTGGVVLKNSQFILSYLFRSNYLANFATTLPAHSKQRLWSHYKASIYSTYYPHLVHSRNSVPSIDSF